MSLPDDQSPALAQNEEWQRPDDHEASFRALFERHRGWTFGFFCKRGFSGADAEDLLQQTFLNAWKSLDQFRNEASFKSWLFVIATNVYRKAVKRRIAMRTREELSFQDRPRHEADTTTDLSSRSLPDGRPRDEQLASLLAKEKLDRVLQAMNTLPPKMRRCVLLRVYHDYSYKEIATLLRIAPETARAHLFKARTALSNVLREDFEDFTL